MPEEVQKDFVRRYQDFAANCKTLLRVCPSQGIADKLNDERARLAASLNTEQRLDKELADARRQYQAAVKANQDRSKAAGDTQKNLQSKAAELQKLIKNLDTAPPSVANKVKTGALVELLTAAATGKSDSTDPDLAPALEIAKTIPALAQSIEVARAQQRTVPVSHLLIALNDLTIRAERDQRLRALDAEELSIVERKIDAVDAQGTLWRRYNDQLCNLVLLAGGLKHPEQSCGIIKFSGELSDPKLTCTVEFSDSKTSPIPVKDCILARSWRSLLEDTLREPQARALNEAAAAYLHVRLVTYTSSTLEFRRIDVDQRRNVVSSEAALRQWKNLVSVPTDELAGYYAGGIKPAELADLIVKALGFSAIAIGAAQ
jgi:hypothetical protein